MPATRPHVFRRLMASGQLTLTPRLLSKATLTELSHVLENAVIEHDLEGAVFTGFQRSTNWLRALARYERLVEPRARSVAVFAAGNVATMGHEDIVKVELAEDSPLVEEWFLIVLTPAFSAVLIGEEAEPDTSVDGRSTGPATADPDDVPAATSPAGSPASGSSSDTAAEDRAELERLFRTIWSFDPEVVTTVASFIRDEVATFDADVAGRIDRALDRFPPSRSGDQLRDEVLSDIVIALERSRLRQSELADLQRRAAQELRALDRAKTAFLSAVSHELRTPLTVVRGMAETLDRIGDDLPADAASTLRAALHQQAERLGLLLDDLLDVDRMTRGALRAHIERVDLGRLLREVTAEHPSAPRITLESPTTCSLIADGVQVERIVVNLLDNATKYAPDGPIEVSLSEQAGAVRLAVRDHGPGIPADQHQQVFEPFHRADEEHPQPGTGIGLTLVAEFARLHGGEARVESPPDGGARLVVTIPIEPATT
ncbi:MAG: hypothetical protein JJT89_14250 [Nitriliruptoraceae bacterium]|nr:hypothetical protein [Nitriliruptoraceae bacterium]